MKIFIRATSCISPQESFNHNLFCSQPKEYSDNFLKVIEPDYGGIFDAKQMRRMSKVIRIGVATAITCLNDAGEKNTDAIITGTSYGCLEDSELFLKKIILQNETMLSPTAFIQSTHNTVGSQIALALKCHEYNNTFVHKGFSFENALLDAMLLFSEGKAKTILAGSDDEMTDLTFEILKRFGLYKSAAVSNLDLFKSASKGSIAGEGAAYFLLADIPSKKDYAALAAVDFFYKPESNEVIKQKIKNFIGSQHLKIDEIDLLIVGRNGDVRNDKIYDELQNDIFENIPSISYKHLCGEYPTSSSFALWLAANIMRLKKLPGCFEAKTRQPNKLKNVLIYNNYLNRYHSLLLLSSCNNA